jgi:hypothetical protein
MDVLDRSMLGDMKPLLPVHVVHTGLLRQGGVAEDLLGVAVALGAIE